MANYKCHGTINFAFWSTKECAISQNSIVNTHVCPLPSKTSSYMQGFSLSSHTFYFVAVKSYKYLVLKPNASSIAYPSTILPLGLTLFHTYPFNVFM
jgi:hypothetical protein